MIFSFRPRRLCALALMLYSASVVVLSAAEPTPPSYDKEIDGLMRKYCATCHNRKTARGNLSVITYDGLIKNRKGKAVVVPGEPDKSALLRTMEGHKPVMPPKGTTLQPTKDEIARVRAWIAAGAQDDTPE